MGVMGGYEVFQSIRGVKVICGVKVAWSLKLSLRVFDMRCFINKGQYALFTQGFSRSTGIGKEILEEQTYDQRITQVVKPS
ncbi:hypothetical protein TNCV_3415581 [Trichonephila clavipes]|nr:hypothetical protein TNCV_3415581 [Trichonephila clavipes]